MIEKKLKPCPFCGGNARLVEYQTDAGFWCYCMKCRITRQKTFRTKSGAINDWNRRVKEEVKP